MEHVLTIFILSLLALVLYNEPQWIFAFYVAAQLFLLAFASYVLVLTLVLIVIGKADE